MKTKIRSILTVAVVALLCIAMLTSCELIAGILGGACDHEYGALIPRKDPTPTEDGHIQHYKCELCGKTFDSAKNPVDDVIIPKLTHEVTLIINGTDYGMNPVNNPSSNEKSYFYGYAELKPGDKILLRDERDDEIYDFDDISDEFAWNLHDFHRGDNGDIVIGLSARYAIEFDRAGDKTIYISKILAPMEGDSFGVAVEYVDAPIVMDGMNLADDAATYNEFMYLLIQEDTVNVKNTVDFIEKNGLYVYFASVTLDNGERFTLKNLTDNTVIGSESLYSAYYVGSSLRFDGEYIKIVEPGTFSITYIPAYNCFSIQKIGSDS